PEGQNREQPIGTKFTQRIREGGRITEYEGEVTAYEKPYHLGVRIGSPQFSVDVDYRL
ncbi:MAG: SRPBCC family protein, partial [Anaerolineae bacterium]|nr:SRPBCC family protein [Anaerolineae bacterium]